MPQLVRIDELLPALRWARRGAPRWARVAQYAPMPDGVPPIVVYDTPKDRLLVDGHHRVAAAHRNGATVIEADIRRGSPADALRFPAALGAAQRGVAERQATARILTRDTGAPGAHRDDGAEP